MRKPFLALWWLLAALAYGGFFITGVDVSDYPVVVVKAIADVPDPENMSIAVYEGDKEIEDITFLGLLRASKNAKVDVIFVFDITGSMEDEIDALVEKAKDFVDEIASVGFDYRLSLVTFRDEVVKGDYGFTSDVHEFKRWLSSLEASGGGDTPEAALDALMYAMRLPARRDAQKVLILITDAPFHHKDDGSGFSRYRPEDVRKMMARFGFTIYSVSPDTEDYRDLVAGFGKVFDIHSRGGFSKIIDDIASTIKSEFSFSYRTVERASGETVTFEVKALYMGRKGRRILKASGTYEVPPRPVVDEHEISQEGCATLNPNLPKQRAIIMARRAAELEAKQMILEYIKGIRLDSETTVGDMMTDEDIRSEIEGTIMGARIVKESFDEEMGVYCVEVKVNYRYIVDKISGKPTYSISPLKGVVIARGVALINKKVKPAGRAILLARRGAIVIAQRNLLEAIQGIHIDAESTVEDAEGRSGVIVARVEGIIRGAVIVDEMKKHKSLKDIYNAGYYWVTMAVAINDEGRRYLEGRYNVSGGETLLDVLRDHIEVGEEYVPPVAGEVEGIHYRAVVIDAEGMNLVYTISGYKIYHESGTLLFAPAVEGRKTVKLIPSVKDVKGKAIVLKAARVEGNRVYVKGDLEKLKKLIAAAVSGDGIYLAGYRMVAGR